LNVGEQAYLYAPELEAEQEPKVAYLVRGKGSWYGAKDYYSPYCTVPLLILKRPGSESSAPEEALRFLARTGNLRSLVRTERSRSAEANTSEQCETHDQETTEETRQIEELVDLVAKGADSRVTEIASRYERTSDKVNSKAIEKVVEFLENGDTQEARNVASGFELTVGDAEEIFKALVSKGWKETDALEALVNLRRTE
jgi:hypothetical protein